MYYFLYMASIIEDVGNKSVKIRDDGYISATELCDGNGKKWNNYYQNITTKSFLNELSVNTGIPINVLVESKKGGRYKGTWVHPKVAIHLAHWISPAFAVEISNWVIKWTETEDKNNEEFITAISNLKICDKSQQEEYIIKQRLKVELNAEEEIVCESGQIDLMTDTSIIEIKEVDGWKHAMGQILAYGLSHPNKSKVIYLFWRSCSNTSKCDKDVIINSCNAFNIQVRFI